MQWTLWYPHIYYQTPLIRRLLLEWTATEGAERQLDRTTCPICMTPFTSDLGRGVLIVGVICYNCMTGVSISSSLCSSKDTVLLQLVSRVRYARLMA